MFSTQETGNTCYFQSYWFALFCKIGKPAVKSSTIEIQNSNHLLQAANNISLFLIQFFVENLNINNININININSKDDKILRILTNPNIILDFMR